MPNLIFRSVLGPVLLLFSSICLSVQAQEELRSIAEALGTIEELDLRAHVEVLADDSLEGREAGSRGGHAAAKYIALHMQKYGLETAGDGGSYYQVFGKGYRNLLGLLPGTDASLKDEVIVVGAHYDHVGYGSRTDSFGPYGTIHNGADDNASGTSAILEMIEAFDQLEVGPRRSILFCLWDGEEKGLLGSKHWLSAPTLSLENVKFSINLDMIGRLRQEGLSVYGERTAAGLREFLSSANRERLQIQFNWDIQPDSDHYPFIRKQIPTVMMHTGLHGEYHRPSDDIDTLNYVGLQSVARYVARTLWALADRAESFRFRPAAMMESETARRTFERFAPPFSKRLGVALDPEMRAGDRENGLRIEKVLVGSPAAVAGLQAGDEILSLNGIPLQTQEQLWNLIFGVEKRVVLEVRNDSTGESSEVQVRLGGSPLRIGLSWRFDKGHPGLAYITRVSTNSRADRAGLRPGHRIYRVNNEVMLTDLDLQQELNEAEGLLELQVESRGQVRVVQIELAKPAASQESESGHP